MRCCDVAGAADYRVAAVSSEYNDGCDSTLQRTMQVGECLNIQHVYFINKQHARHQFSYALINVLVYDFIDLFTQFICK